MKEYSEFPYAYPHLPLFALDFFVVVRRNKHPKFFFKFAEYGDLVELTPRKFQFVPENRRYQVQ